MITYQSDTNYKWWLSGLGTDLGYSTNAQANNARLCMLGLALGEVGQGDGFKYYENTLDSTSAVDWCGIFMLWAAKKCGMYPTWKWEVGKGFLYKLPIIQTPVPGDFAYYTKNQHHAIVYDVQAGVLTTISGNGVNGKVSIGKGSPSSPAAYYRALSTT